MTIKPGDSRPATWWIPGQRRRLPGTYEVGEDGGVEITVIGSLAVFGLESGPVRVIWGEVDGTEVTCEESWPTFMSSPDARHERQRLWVTRAYEGARLRNPSHTKFKIAEANISNLQQLRRIRMLELNAAGPRHKHIEDLVAHTSRGRVQFRAGVTESWSALPESMSLSALHRVLVEPPAPATYDEIWRDLLMPLGGLLAVAGNGTASVSDVWLHPVRASAHAPTIRVRVHEASNDDPPVRDFDMLIHGGNWDIGVGVAQFLDLWDRCAVGFTSYLESHRAASMHFKFLYAASACEALHGALRPDRDTPSPRHQARLDRVLQDISPHRDRRWVEGILKRSHIPSLQTRLSDLVGGLDENFARLLVGESHVWASHIGGARNALSHSDQRAIEYYQDPRVLHEMTQTLHTVFLLSVLQQLGFTRSEAAHLFMGNYQRRWTVGRYLEVTRDAP